MSTTAVEATIDELEARLVRPRAPGSFAEGELEGLPDPVRRYLRASIHPGTPLAQSARFRMRGSIELGKLWIPFRARPPSSTSRRSHVRTCRPLTWVSMQGPSSSKEATTSVVP